MKNKGPALQTNLNDLTERFATDLNLEFAKRDLPIEIKYFGSLWRLKFLEEIPYSELLFVLLREKNVHIWDGFPCFMTTAFKAEDVNKLKIAFISSVDELIAAQILKSEYVSSLGSKNRTPAVSIKTPPVPGARLGMDASGNPAWYVADEQNQGAFKKIELSIQ